MDTLNPRRGNGMPRHPPGRAARTEAGGLSHRGRAPRSNDELSRRRVERAGAASVRGFTLLELLVALAVAAILATLAVPSFGSLRRAAALATTTNELLAALHFARSSAVRRGVPVTLCLSSDGHACLASAQGLAGGWLVFEQPEAKVSDDASPPESILRSFRLPESLFLQGTRPAVTFWPFTRAGTTSTFALCDPHAEGRGRAIIVSQTGRPRVSTEKPACAR